MQPLTGITVVTLEHAIAAPFATRQLAARRRWAEVGTTAGPVPVMQPPGSWDTGPRMDPVSARGEHTGIILKELGYSTAEIAGLRAAKAV